MPEYMIQFAVGIESWEPVDSTNLAAVGYSETLQHLFVEFHDSGVYLYYGVDSKTYQGLRDAESAGSYFHANVKDIYMHDVLVDRDGKLYPQNFLDILDPQLHNLIEAVYVVASKYQNKPFE